MKIRSIVVALAAVTTLSAQPAFARIQHFVGFKFKDGVTEAARQKFRTDFLALQEKAKRDGKPYILSIVGGGAISREGFDQNQDAAFIVAFRNTGDRDYFVGAPYSTAMDPAHAALVKVALDMLDRDGNGRPIGLYVFDFDDGIAS